MEPTKIDLDISLLHIKQMEAGASSLRSRIARIREYGVATVAEEDELAGLLRAIEVLRVHVVNMTAPAEGAVANIAAPMSPIGA
jgi:hypothetical protein